MFRILAPVALAAALVLPAVAQADTYTSANFSAGAFGGGANVKAPFLGLDIYPGASFTGHLVYDNALVPAAGSGFVNVAYADFPDIGAIPPADAFTLNFGPKTFTLADANPGSAAIQYNDGKFNGFFYASDFQWAGGWYQLSIQGGSLTVLALDAQKNPIFGNNFVSGYVNIGDTSLTDKQAYTVPSAPVPEPGTWALMLIGFFGAGFALRRGRSVVVLARA